MYTVADILRVRERLNTLTGKMWIAFRKEERESILDNVRKIIQPLVPESNVSSEATLSAVVSELHPGMELPAETHKHLEEIWSIIKLRVPTTAVPANIELQKTTA